MIPTGYRKFPCSAGNIIIQPVTREYKYYSFPVLATSLGVSQFLWIILSVIRNKSLLTESCAYLAASTRKIIAPSITCTYWLKASSLILLVPLWVTCSPGQAVVQSRLLWGCVRGPVLVSPLSLWCTSFLFDVQAPQVRVCVRC